VLIFIDLDRIDGAVDGDRIAPIVVIPTQNLSGLELNDVDLGAGCSSLSFGTINSDCSKPSAASIATLCLQCRS
jgi:hypothetical protein